MTIYRIFDDPRGARDFAELLESCGATVEVEVDGMWTDVKTDAIDENVHDAMIHAEWREDRDGPHMEVFGFDD